MQVTSKMSPYFQGQFRIRGEVPPEDQEALEALRTKVELDHSLDIVSINRSNNGWTAVATYADGSTSTNIERPFALLSCLLQVLASQLRYDKLTEPL